MLLPDLFLSLLPFNVHLCLTLGPDLLTFLTHLLTLLAFRLCFLGLLLLCRIVAPLAPAVALSAGVHAQTENHRCREQ